MTAADSEAQYKKNVVLLINYLQTPAQPPFSGNLRWSRECPLNKGCIMATLEIVFGPKKTLFDKRSPFSKIRLELEGRLHKYCWRLNMSRIALLLYHKYVSKFSSQLQENKITRTKVVAKMFNLKKQASQIWPKWPRNETFKTIILILSEMWKTCYHKKKQEKQI